MRTLMLGALAAALTAGAPALAQTADRTVEQLTVTGRWTARGEPPATLSRVVSYADLDLRTASDQNILRRRVSDAAREICDELGQDRPNRTNLGRSCQETAVRGARGQIRVAVADAATHPHPAYAAAPPAPPPPQPQPQASAAPVAPPTAESYAAPASVTTRIVTNGPIADTPASRERYGGPLSNAGRRTAPAGN